MFHSRATVEDTTATASEGPPPLPSAARITVVKRMASSSKTTA